MSMSEIENSYSESGHDENQDSGNISVAPVSLIAKDSLNKITELPLSRALMEPSPFDAPLPRMASVGSSSILIPERRSDHLLQDAYAAQRDSLLRQSSQNSDDAEASAQTLFQGATFTKLGQFGKPKPKFLVCSQDGNLFWSDVSGGKTLSSIRLLHVTAVQKGKGSELFQRKQAKDIPEELCFSILTKDRSLDLVADSEQTRDYWVKAVLLAAENVQTTGKVARVPVAASTERERKDRELERSLQELNNQLSQTKQAVFQKTQELLEKEQLLVAQREETSSHVAEREAEAERLRQETERLRQEQEELNQRLKKVHHEREQSRSERLAEMANLQSELAKAEEARLELEQKATSEKTQLKTVVEESHKLLAKAKDTIHKRQQSRQQRVAVIEALQTENEELRSRNLELRQAMAVHKAQIEQWNKIVQLAASNYHLSKLLKDGGVDLNPAATMAKPEAKECPAPAMASISETKSDETGVISAAEVLNKEMWQPDEESAQCIRCNNTFTFFKRRHHCRKCGVLVCGPCSKSRVKVSETKDKVRVCCTCVSPSCAPSPALSRKAPSTPIAQ